MKEIKFLLYSLYIAIYTSLWWASFMFHGIWLGAANTREGFPLGYVLCGVVTGINIIVCLIYLSDHWQDDK